HLKPINKGSTHSDSCAVLVIMKHGDGHTFTQLTLNLKALGCFNIFEIDAAKGGFKCGNNINKLIWIAFIDFNIKHIKAAELLKQYRFPLHHRFGSQSPNIAKP